MSTQTNNNQFNRPVTLAVTLLCTLLLNLTMSSLTQAQTGDSFEDDDTCEQAKPITADGIEQVHTFHDQYDEDWLYFYGRAGTFYTVYVWVPSGSSADIQLAIYDSCDKIGDPSYRTNIQNSFPAPYDGYFYLRLENPSSTYGEDAEYHISVSSIDPTSSKDALIVVAGKFKVSDHLQSNIHYVTNNTYKLFRDKGYPSDRIYYLATDLTLDADGDSQADVNALSTNANLEYAITEWSKSRVKTGGYLTLYLMGPGGEDTFYLDRPNDEILTPTALDDWLTELEQAVPGVKINLVIDTSQAGTFIDPTSGSVSKTGRVVIASASAEGEAYASSQGSVFSDPFLAALNRNLSLHEAFKEAQAATETAESDQTPWIDSDGDGIPNETDDETIASQRNLFDQGDSTPQPTDTPTPTNSPTPQPTSTPTNTSTPQPTPTDTPTSQSISTNTPTPQPTVRPTDTLQPTVDPTTYEPNDTCAQAQPITTDGTIQEHNFQTQADIDWVRFEAVDDAVYLIEARVPDDSPADMLLELYEQCGGASDLNDSFNPNVNLQYKATRSGPYFMKLKNDDPEIYGEEVTYQLSVRTLSEEPTPGALILVAGRLYATDHRQDNIHHTTNKVYNTFLKQGYSADRIYYLATNTFLDPDDNPATEDVDALGSRERLQYAITQWATDPALELGPDRALTLYMLDHGNQDKFYIDGRRETVTTADLDEWLTILETAQPGVRVNVIIDACLSGSFINPTEGTLSKAGRVVIASTTNVNNAYTSREGGMNFSDLFIQSLGNQKSLYASFMDAQEAANGWRSDQQAWLDDNGDGYANRHDGHEAQRRGFAFAGSLAANEFEPPYIAWAKGPDQIENRRGQLSAQVRDDVPEGNLYVWAVIYEPSYTPPPASEELVSDEHNLPHIRLLKDSEDPDIYTAIYPGFDQTGEYRIVVYATDEDDMQSKPKVITFSIGGSSVYLPMVVK